MLVIIALLTGGREAQAAAPSKHEHRPGSRTVADQREQVGEAAPVPPPAAAMAAYQQVEEWVRAWRVPEAAGAAPVGAAAAAAFAGVHIQIRLDGQWIGRGQAFAPESDARANSAAMLALARAGDGAGRIALVLPNDATRDAAIVEYARRMMISVELAGALSIGEPRTGEEAEIMLAPGLDGVAVRIRPEGGVPGALEAAFPTFMMATGVLPHRTLGGLCAKVIGEGGAAAALEPPANIRTRHALRMYRFRTTHLAQCAPGAGPVFLHRGARLIAQSEITAAELHRMAAAMAEHLRRTQEGVESPESAALAAFALRGYLNVGALGASERGAMQERTDHLVAGIAAKSGDAPHAASLLALLAEHRRYSQGPMEMCGNPWLDRHTRLAARIMLIEQPPGNLFERLPAPLRGLYALVYSLYPQLATPPGEQFVLGRELATVDVSIRVLLGATAKGEYVAHMPWLGWAEVELAAQISKNDGQPADIPSAIALREMRRQVWEHMISAADAEETPDFAGGIVFTKGRSPLPTWQSARPLAFIATMLRDDRLTDPHEKMTELVKLLEAIRFIRQLQADESIGWMALDPAAAVGGVRAAPWDFTLPPDATSLSLLLVTETIRSLDALTKPAEPPAPAR